MLLSLRQISDDILLGVWRIEPQAQLSVRQNERLAVKRLLARMLDVDTIDLEHLPSGKPMLSGWHVSVSHTRGFAAAILSRSHEVGVDIEYRSDRVGRVASRFLREDEEARTLARQLAFWSAKETVYKLFSEDALTFVQMRLVVVSETCDVRKDGVKHAVLQAENLKRGQRVQVDVEETEAYTLTWASV